MKRLPEYLPEYKIELSNKGVFAVRHEELPGMHIIPKRHEKLSFGMYDFPAKKLTDMEVARKRTENLKLHELELAKLNIEKMQITYEQFVYESERKIRTLQEQVKELEKQTQAILSSQQQIASKNKAVFIISILTLIGVLGNLGVVIAHLLGLL